MNLDNVLSSSAGSRVNELHDLLEKNAPIVLFGSGYLGKKVGLFFKKINKDVRFFLDNNEEKWGTELIGTKVVSPSSIDKDIVPQAVFIVCIWSPSHSYKKTKAELEQSGAVNIFHVATMAQLFPNDLLPHYHFQTPAYYIQHSAEIREVYDSLADAESKKQYLAVVDCRVNASFDELPEPDYHNQYFPGDIISLSDKEVFLDAGAYTGDTFTDFAKRVNDRFTKYLAIEPDPENYKKLANNVSQYISSGQVEIFPYAVGAEHLTLKFSANGNVDSSIDDSGLLEVECVKIDDIFFDYQPTFLKFDIEGSELNALKGADKTITAFEPILTVCIYHLPDDIWTIPLYLKTKYPFYNFYVRLHGIDGWEFVLYAIPKTAK